MKMKVKIKDQYNKAVKFNGITYHFDGMNEEKLQMVWQTNPQLRFMFQELPKFEEIDEKDFLDAEQQLKDIGINNNEEFKKVVKKAITKKK